MTDAPPGPADRRKAQIDRINELSQLARTAWFTLLAYLVFVGITLLGVEDADFFLASRQTQLPLVNVQIPTASFFWTAPVLGAALYTYLHLFLIKLWDAHGEARTSDADPTHHWLVGDFVLIRQRDPVAWGRPLAWLTDWITRFLVWASGPIVLAYAWWRAMPAHGEWLTLLIAACLFLTLVVGFTSWWRAEERLAGRPWRAPWSARWQRPAAALVAALLVVVSWLRTEGGLDEYAHAAIDLADAVFGTSLITDCAPLDVRGSPIIGESPADCFFANGDPKDPADVQRDRIAASPFVPKLDTFTLTSRHWLASLWLDGGETWNPLARTDLSDGALGWPPEGWRDHNYARRHYREAWCERRNIDLGTCETLATEDGAEAAALQQDWCSGNGVAADDCAARFASLAAAFEDEWGQERGNYLFQQLATPDQAGRDLRRADLSGTFLAGASLFRARLEGAVLWEARLEGAVLWEALLEGADLEGARLEGAYLVGARLEGAVLRQARLEGAVLLEARLEGADLWEARLEGADLRGARLGGAYLEGARLQGAYLDGARLEGAHLGGARLERAVFRQARLERANLEAARLEGAVLWGARLEGADLRGARLEGADLRHADFREANWGSASNRASPAQSADFRGSQDLTQAQVDQMIGNEGTLLPDAPSDTGAPFYVWSCWETPPPDIDRIVATAAGPIADDADRARLRAEFLCSPDNPRRKTGTPLALDSPYPEGHPLADRN